MLEQIVSISGVLAGLVSVVSAVIGFTFGHSTARKRQELDDRLREVEKSLVEAQSRAAALSIKSNNEDRLSKALEAVSAARIELEQSNAGRSDGKTSKAAGEQN